MNLEFQPGLWPDWTGVSVPPRWKTGFNVRFRQGRPESMGILRPLRDVGGTQSQVDVSGGRPNLIAVCNRGSTAQVLIGTLNKLYVAEPSPDSTLVTGTRWAIADITPAGLTPIADDIGPDLGRTVAAKAWWKVVLGNTIIVGRGGNLDEPPFVWDRDPSHIATPVPNAPHRAIGGFKSPNNHLHLLGCEDESLGWTGLTDRWANQSTIDSWASAVTSTAGAFEMSSGSRIVAGDWTGFQGTVWTDSDLFQVQELNDTSFFFRPSKLSNEAGLAAAKLWTEHNGALWWLGHDMQVRRYRGGTPEVIPCTVGRETFDQISRESVHRGFMHPVAAHGEIWIWCSTGAEQLPDRAAVFSDREQSWTIARYPRSAMCDRSGPLRPLGVGEDGMLYEHEAAIIDDTPSYGNDAPFARSWGLRSALFLPPVQTPEAETADLARLVVDMERVSAPGDEASVVNVAITAYDWLRRNVGRKTADLTVLANDTDFVDLREGGRSFELEFAGDDKTETRFGQMLVGLRKAGSER
jgi:hypothetical protein